MPDPETIRTAFQRNAKALTLKPAIGKKTAVTKIRVRDGTTCDIEHGEWRFTADVGAAQGGNNAGPGPGVLERAALGSCLAVGYATWAAHRDVPIDHLEVDVETEYDARGMYGVADVPPGFSVIRYRVRIQSPAPEADVLRMLDEADAHSPVRDDFARAIPVEREVCITSAATP